MMLVGNNGIILNGDKFRFSKDTVDGAGIRLRENKVQPIPEHVKAIREFPKPMNITDMRTYWALVKQVYSVQPQLAPFRDLLKKNTNGTGMINIPGRKLCGPDALSRVVQSLLTGRRCRC